MLNNKEINMTMNLPREDNDINENENFHKLFHCVNCGLHQKAFTVSIAKGDDSKTLTTLLSVLPGKIKVIEIFGELPCGSEIIETVFCGKCGSAGNWDIIPQLLLEQMGVKIFEPEENMQPETKTEETNKGDSNEL